MTTTVNRSSSWVSFDSGASSVSRSHLEATIINHAKKLKLDLQWLVSFQLTEGLRRVAFVMASNDEGKLQQLSTDLSDYFPSFAGESERRELIEKARKLQDGRAVHFPLSVDISESVSAKNLINGSAVDAIIAIGEELPSDAQIQSNGYIRPTMNSGRLELFVERIAGGFFAPVERESPHECCGGHGPEEPINL